MYVHIVRSHISSSVYDRFSETFCTDFSNGSTDQVYLLAHIDVAILLKLSLPLQTLHHHNSEDLPCKKLQNIFG